MRFGRAFMVGGIAIAVAVGATGCARALPESIAEAPVLASDAPRRSAAEPTKTPETTFRSVVDGDTIETSAGTVRIIGIDTPERGVCGYEQASAALAAVLRRGDAVVLELPAGENDRDKHDRLIRYVTTQAGVDLGLLQLQAGNAVARYDSRDGYPSHPREAAYHAAQLATLGADGAVITTACKPTVAAAPLKSGNEPATVAPTNVWWTKYFSCSKVKRNTVGDPRGPFHKSDPSEAQIYDWFENGTGNNGDGDDDGIACE